jgi:hypothetical protein
MAEKLPEEDGPSLELPSLFGRRKKRTTAQPAAAEPVPEPEPTVVTPAPAPEPPPPPVEAVPDEPSEPRELRLPAWASSTAALVVGAVVGGLGCALTWVGLRGCELVTGTDSCGGPGLLVLVLILVAMVVAGTAALKLFGVQDAVNLSLLGVGLLAALVLLFLTDHLDEPWMLLGIPALTALCFWLAHQVATSHIDEADLEPTRHPERHDVR